LACGVGCSWAEQTASGDTNNIDLEDFVSGDASPGQAQDSEPNTGQVLAASQDPEGQGSTPTSAGSQAIATDAMVGHVNGEAIYANAIFQPINARLTAVGRRTSDREFLSSIAPVIEGRLTEMILNKLILAEADGDLSERERMQVDGMVEAQREEYLRFYGQGSLSRAKAEYLAAEGMELDEALLRFREQLTVRHYLQQQIRPQINVQQRDVERWYRDHLDQFRSPPKRVVRMVMCDDADKAQRLADRLASGESFETLASDPELNSYNPAAGGMFNDGEPLTGEEIFSITPLNDAALALNQGEYAGPIEANERFFFVYLEVYEPAIEVALRDVQVDIEERMRLTQWDALFLRFREDLWNRGSFTDPSEMMAKLLEIAVARYDRAE